MTTFFLIAGFFGNLLFHRLGPIAFLSDRAKRIGIPLAFGWVVLSPAVLGVPLWAWSRFQGRRFPLQPLHEAGRWLPMDHLWFLYVLMWMYGFVLILRAVFVKLIDRHGAWRSRIDGVVTGLIGRAWAPLVLAAPLGVCLYFEPDWVIWFGIPIPDGLLPGLAASVGFGMAFSLGWLVRRQPMLLEVWGRRWSGHAIAGVALTFAALAIAGIEPVFVPAIRGWHSLAYAVCYSVAVWAFTFAFIGAGVRFFSEFNELRRYISDSSYWIYLAHYPVVIYGQYIVREWPLHWTLKFPVFFAMILTVLFASYHFAVRWTWIGAVLNGRWQVPRPSIKVSESSL
jgi:peptidoglycan/LPS O-acetylase OafA/YrhL